MNTQKTVSKVTWESLSAEEKAHGVKLYQETGKHLSPLSIREKYATKLRAEAGALTEPVYFAVLSSTLKGGGVTVKHCSKVTVAPQGAFGRRAAFVAEGEDPRGSPGPAWTTAHRTAKLAAQAYLDKNPPGVACVAVFPTTGDVVSLKTYLRDNPPGENTSEG